MSKQDKRVFISHPYQNDPQGNVERANKICKRIVERSRGHILPVSPLHLFSFLEDDKGYRSNIMFICYQIIPICDELWVYGDSEGCRTERQYAEDLGIKVRDFTGDSND